MYPEYSTNREYMSKHNGQHLDVVPKYLRESTPSYPPDRYIDDHYPEDRTSIDLESEPDPQNTQRFVAGQAFFNYEAGGSLREGLLPIQLFSRTHIGLAIAALYGGFFLCVGRNHLLPMISAHLGYTGRTVNTALTCLMVLPTGFSIAFGMLSDKYPLYGYRRKPYMILGFVSLGIVMSAVMALFYWGNVDDKVIRGLFITCGVLITVTGVTALMPIYAMTIEYAQREHLHRRGELQSTVWLLTFFTQAIAGGLIPVNIKRNMLTGEMMKSTWDIGQVSLVLAFGAFATSLCVIFFLEEDIAPSLSKSSMQYGFMEMWAMIKQFVFAGILIGLCGMQFFTFGVNQNIETARLIWSGLDASDLSSMQGVQFVAEFVGVIICRLFFVNANWRKMGMVGTIMCFIAQLMGVVPVCYEVLKSKVLYFLWIAVASIPQGWITVLVQLISTEVTKPGQEGAVVGLLLSIYFLFTLGSMTIWDKFSNLILPSMTDLEIFVGSHDTRMHIFRRALVFACIHLIGFATITVLPTQKLDAQQRLAFGGSNNTIRTGVLLTFLGIFLYDLISNLHDLI